MGNYKQFFDSFFKGDGAEYVQQVLSGKIGIVINLDKMDPNFASFIINEPMSGPLEDIKNALSEAVYSINHSMNTTNLEIGFCGDCIFLIKLRNISSEHIGKLIKVRGLVSRISQIRPFYTEVTFACRECGELTPLIIQENPLSLTKPAGKCPVCKNRIFDARFEFSKTIDSQEFSIQELHEDIKAAAIPRKLPMITFKNSLLNLIGCGDLVEIIGIIKLTSIRRKGRTTRFTDPYMEVYHIIKKSKDPEEIEISPTEEKMILEIARRENVFELLVVNLAPSLYGMKWAKKSVLLALFGGIRKVRKDITIRGNISVLLVGDPSTGKSQLLRAAADLAPRGVLAGGRGTSAAGLTAALIHDERTGEWTIQAGVLVLADKGIACIDEIDKMDKKDRINIHEAMAQQTVTINKAGIHAKLNARTAVIAAANPVMGIYDSEKTIQENIGGNFPPTLLNRFDLIFILQDKINREFDVEVLKLIGNEEENAEILDRELFRKYIAYAKRIKPKTPEGIKSQLSDYFLRVREQVKRDKASGRVTQIPIAYRQAEALFRIAEAHARALLKTEVDEDDLQFTITIFDEFLRQMEFDTINLATGKGRVLRDIIEFMFNIIGEHNDGLTKKEFINLAIKRGLSDKEAEKGFNQLLKDSMIYLVESGLVSVYKRT